MNVVHFAIIPTTFLRARRMTSKPAKIKKGNSLLRDVEVLILSSDLDYPTDRVCLHLRESGVQYLRLNRENLSANALTLEPSGPVLECRNEVGTWRIGKALRSVWWRQGTFDRRFADPLTSIDTQISATQWPAFMRSMMVFDGAKWVNHPSHIYRAETKAVQLLEASRTGFHVPSTLMTNDRLAPVVEIIGPKIALKSIDTLLLRQGDEQLFGYTQLANWDEVSNDYLHLAPATVQLFLDSKTDLRVTVLGDEVWCVSVLKSGGQIIGDWRLTPKKDLIIQDFDMPRTVSDMCKELTRRLGLVFGAIDLVYSGGKYWFIEINPTGEWGWLDFDGREISKSIAGILAQPC